ncbi:hypothetical protein FQN50_006626 [Emmonsiellopsis sp. PD_5]|nr:hypothetical protein FQN50_006626 [Emmonsiellopsis sp. PD_5]
MKGDEEVVRHLYTVALNFSSERESTETVKCSIEVFKEKAKKCEPDTGWLGCKEEKSGLLGLRSAANTGAGFSVREQDAKAAGGRGQRGGNGAQDGDREARQPEDETMGIWPDGTDSSRGWMVRFEPGLQARVCSGVTEITRSGWTVWESACEMVGWRCGLVWTVGDKPKTHENRDKRVVRMVRGSGCEEQFIDSGSDMDDLRLDRQPLVKNGVAVSGLGGSRPV